MKKETIEEFAEELQDFYKIGDFDEHCDDGCKYNCTKGNTQLAECLNKQETLEEAADKKILLNERKGFLDGAKWQQDQDAKVIQDLKTRLDIANESSTKALKMIEKLEKKIYNMFDTLEKTSINNVATITNVELFINSWKRHFKN